MQSVIWFPAKYRTAKSEKPKMSKTLCEYETTPGHLLPVCGEPYEHHVDNSLGHEFVTNRKIRQHIGDPCLLCNKPADEQYPFGCEKWWRPEEWSIPSPLVYMIADGMLTLERANELVIAASNAHASTLTGADWEAFNESLGWTPESNPKVFMAMVKFVVKWTGSGSKSNELWYNVQDKKFEVTESHSATYAGSPIKWRYCGKLHDLRMEHDPAYVEIVAQQQKEWEARQAEGMEHYRQMTGQTTEEGPAPAA